MATDTLATPAGLSDTQTRVFKNFIDGEWVDSSSGETFENRNPADTRDLVGIFQKSNKSDVDAAVAAAKRAFAKAFGRPTVFIREGGSIPFVRTIADATGKPCLLMGFGQPDENAHAPNEWLDLENYHLGIKSAAYLYDELSKLG